jgi:acetoin utilization deacetylase AcuC-like enzyme
MRVHSALACLDHPAPPGFPERPERLRRILDHLAGTRGFELAVAPAEEGMPVAGAALDAAIARVHAPDYVERFRRAAARGDGLLDTADNPIAPASFGAARAAAGSTLAALDDVVSGRSPRAFAAVRPPGHHAERAHAMGFCFFNNAAVAAEHAIVAHGRKRVAIVDFDVHHGNGTQHAFEERADVLYASLHQWPFYPGTGAAAETGRGAGKGATLNVPLSAGCGDDEYEAAWRTRVIPALERFAPDLLIVSAGFDAWQGDPLAGMRVTEVGFASWGVHLRRIADAQCGGQCLTVLEGGYDLAALPRLVECFTRNML